MHEYKVVSRMTHWQKTYPNWVSVASILCLIAIWELICQSGVVSSLFLPAPSALINALLEMIAAGCSNLVREESLFIIPDRKKAIRKAFSLAQENDIVLLLGKSHENSIIYKDYVMPYNEITEAEKALQELKK